MAKKKKVISDKKLTKMIEENKEIKKIIEIATTSDQAEKTRTVFTSKNTAYYSI